MTALPYRLDRTIVIQARPEVVFEFLTTDERWAAWWGRGSAIDPRPGGRVYIRHANGIEFEGSVLDVEPPRRLAFTYGNASGSPIPSGGSRVSIELSPEGRGTRVSLTHEFAEPGVRDEHIQGWRFQLSLFANVVLDRQHARVADAVDRWFAVWAEPDGSRKRMLADLVAPHVEVRDRFSLLNGIDDLDAHISAAQRFMPGMRLVRSGGVRHCQGAVLADWSAVGPDDQPRGKGTNLFMLDVDGRIESATGFWS